MRVGRIEIASSISISSVYHLHWYCEQQNDRKQESFVQDYKEMRSDTLTRHMKQHSKKNENNPVTNISVTHNYNSRPDISTQISKEENGINPN